jgi:D-sedoheptulose 7-phosphate isomerase
LKQSTNNIIDDLFIRFPRLIDCKEPIIKTIIELNECFKKGNKLLVCGNGGSAADTLHIVGELMKTFNKKRNIDEYNNFYIKKYFPESSEYLIKNLAGAFPVISLVNETSLITALCNDVDNNIIFAQQVYGYGMKGDILLCLSTSGNSKNIIYAAQIAKTLDLKVISLTGNNGGELKKYSNILINVPFEKTYIIQEYHMPIYHTICLAIENEKYGD